MRTRLRWSARVVRNVAIGLVAAVVLGNAAIWLATVWARETTASRTVSLRGVDNLRVVDEKLWRGAAPTAEGYQELADKGAATVVDLRAEEGIESDRHLVSALGMRYVHIPVRDGQVPSTDKIEAFLQAVRQSPGLVFVHCGAGVGRTGAMVGAYLVSTGEASGRGALRGNLAVGPPSLEQVAFVATLDPGQLKAPGLAVKAMSRALDAPRRIWHRLGL